MADNPCPLDDSSRELVLRTYAAWIGLFADVVVGLGHSWEHTDDLATLLHGTVTTPFNRESGDALHDEVRIGSGGLSLEAPNERE